MDELSTDELRSMAFARNLRRAFGAPDEEAMPPRFAVLLQRLSEVHPPQPSRGRDPYRLGM